MASGSGGLVEQAEADGRVDLVLVGRAQHRVEHLLALVGAPAGDEAELRALGVQRLRAGRGLVGQVRRPGVLALEHLDGQALPAEAVVRRVAQRHREGVDDVLAGGGGAPGVVAAVAELDVEVHAREGGALGVDARPVEVLLHQDLGGEVGHLRAEDRERVAAGRVGARDEQRVGHRLGQRAELGQAQAAGQRGAGSDGPGQRRRPGRDGLPAAAGCRPAAARRSRAAPSRSARPRAP